MDLERKKTLLCVALVIGAGLLIAYPYIDDMMDETIDIPYYIEKGAVLQGMYTAVYYLDQSNVPYGTTIWRMEASDSDFKWPCVYEEGDDPIETYLTYQYTEADIYKMSFKAEKDGFKFNFYRVYLPIE